ncbi:MAG: cytochrome c3 family protein [Deltaproteobacteria bacterium]|nr:cytochrome c3 family protein [Deltaproteobacteria bacterium]
MNIWKKLTIYACGILLTCAVFSMAVMAGGSPLKDNACGACHQDYSKIMPQKHPDVGPAKGTACLTCHTTDPAKNEPTKFSTDVHKVHQGGKTKLECSVCHIL